MTNHERRHLLFVTGTRADFGKLKPLVREVAHRSELEYTIFATGMHLLERYGTTLNEIYFSGFSNVFPYFNQDGAGGSPMDIALANTIHGLSQLVRERRPDLLVVHGDRIEALAGAIVGALNNILVAHIEGGERSGTVDELIRHSVSKLAHAHFVANSEAAERLVQMGEAPEAIYTIGSADIDVMLGDDLPHIDDVLAHYGIESKDYGIVLYHPVTTDLDAISVRAARLVDALLASKRYFVVIAPNNDHGAELIRQEYRRLDDPVRFRHLPSMRFEAFLSLLRGAQAIIGNSSAGIREAPVYGVQTIDLGSRQSNRFAHESIISMDESDPDLPRVIAGMGGRFNPSTHFGDGRTRERFIDVVLAEELWRLPRQKLFRDVGTVLETAD